MKKLYISIGLIGILSQPIHTMQRLLNKSKLPQKTAAILIKQTHERSHQGQNHQQEKQQQYQGFTFNPKPLAAFPLLAIPFINTNQEQADTNTQYVIQDLDLNNEKTIEDCVELSKPYEHLIFDPGQTAETVFDFYKRLQTGKTMPKKYLLDQNFYSHIKIPRPVYIKTISLKSESSKPFGYIIYEEIPKMLILSNIAINQNYHRKNAGSQILSFVEEEAKHKKLQGALVAVYSTNNAMRSFLKKHGYTHIKSLDLPNSRLNNGDTATVMHFGKNL